MHAKCFSITGVMGGVSPLVYIIITSLSYIKAFKEPLVGLIKVFTLKKYNINNVTHKHNVTHDFISLDFSLSFVIFVKYVSNNT